MRRRSAIELIADKQYLVNLVERRLLPLVRQAGLDGSNGHLFRDER